MKILKPLIVFLSVFIIPLFVAAALFNGFHWWTIPMMIAWIISLFFTVRFVRRNER